MTSLAKTVASAIRLNAIARLANWGPAAIWAGLIFCFSTGSFGASSTSRVIEPILSSLMPSLSPDQLAIIHFSIRKFGHLSEYFIFALLVRRAIAREFRAMPIRRHILWTLLAVCLYAASDEWHQSFVPERTASAGDVLLDSAGGSCGVLCFEAARRRRKKLDIAKANSDHS
jgi:VanZ family protein